jgi:hypothetical protein
VSEYRASPISSRALPGTQQLTALDFYYAALRKNQ